MTGQPILAPGLATALRELLSTPEALTSQGAGPANLVEAILILAASADRLAKAVEDFTGRET